EVPIEVVMAGRVRPHVSDIAAELGQMSRFDQLHIGEPVGQTLAQRADACSIAMHDDGEHPPGEMARVMPAGELKGFGALGPIAASCDLLHIEHPSQLQEQHSTFASSLTIWSRATRSSRRPGAKPFTSPK